MYYYVIMDTETFNKASHADWEKFIRGKKEISSFSVSNEVWESWKRSKKSGVDPFSSGFSCVSNDELRRRRSLKSEFRQVATPYINHLHDIIKGSGSIIILADEEGVILDVATDEVSKSIKNFPEAGTIQSEEIEGTNGVGTALVCDKPIQIRGAEHWVSDNHSWTCNAATVHNNNRIIGCLNLSTPSKEINPLSLGLVVSAVNAIERELELRNTLNKVQSLTKSQETILRIMKDGIILISRDGCIIQANDRAHVILEDFCNWKGLHISNVLQCKLNFKEILNNKTMLDSHEIAVKIQNKHNHILVSTAMIDSIEADGSVAILVQESKSMMKIVNKMSGSKAHYNFRDIIGKSSEITECIKLSEQVSQYDSNVLIMGESGTGKELFAQSIHNHSSRRDMPFVAVNCGALSRELVQSELFGYEGGAYTGAKSNGNPGKFELANGGTLFLDEIGELPLELQTNLLRVLQTGEINRIGSKNTISVDVKIITATNINLYAAVDEGTFRKDLFYRINLFTIELPPLRSRRGDILLLSDYFLKRFSLKTGKIGLKLIKEACNRLESYSWPGNIRQLENVIERAVAVSKDEEITSDDLFIDKSIKSETMFNKNETYTGSNESLDSMERNHLEQLVKETRGNLREVSRRLEISRSTVYRKVVRYNLDINKYR